MAILLVYACKGKPGREPEQGPGKDTVAQASAELLNNDSSDTSWPKYKGPYVRHRVFKIRNLTVSTHTFFRLSDEYYSYRESHFLILRDPAKMVADTMELESEDGDMSDNIVEDMSDSLKFKTLVLKLTTNGSSDIPLSEFFEYKDGTLRGLFSVEWLIDISRKDENTLIGIINGRDDILYQSYTYPVIINLKDNTITGEMPDTQAIKHPTITLEPIIVYRKKGEKLSQPLQVKTGTTIVVDTFFRKSGLVRMLLPDSTAVYIKEEDLRQKVESNTAG
jgi:hypothetical protein